MLIMYGIDFSLPRILVTVEVPVVVREVSPVTSSKPPKPVATLPSVKRETKAQMATVSRPATKPARPEVKGSLKSISMHITGSQYV